MSRHTTTQVSHIPLEEYKRTKIIATLGPSTDSYQKIHDLIQAGTNGIRINFSHTNHEDASRWLAWARKAAAALGKPVAIIQDLQGPKIRLGDFDGVIPVQAGQELTFAYGQPHEAGGPIPMQYDISTKAKKGQPLYLFDGRIRTEITHVAPGRVRARAMNDGVLIKRKSMNLPDTDFGGDILTEKDMSDLRYGIKQDFDYIAISFVQSAEDVRRVRNLLRKYGSTAKIIVKVETKRAVEDIEAIVQAADVVMVARGDLAVEAPAESVPVVQRKIVGLGQQYAKPTIVATQMLISMVDMPEPTRAEVSDVATAVFIGADCVMLSDETTVGKYPVEAVATMKRVVLYAEQHSPLKVTYALDRPHDMQNAISSAILSLAESIDAAAIVAETKSGATALQIAARRPATTLIAVTSEDRTAQQLALVYGIKSYVRAVDAQAALKLGSWLRRHNVLHENDIIVTVSGKRPGVTGATDTIKVRVLD